MSNTNPNPSTRFSIGNKAQSQPGANKPHSIQNAVRYFAGQPADTDLPERPTFAQKIAFEQLKKAASGDTQAFEKVTERVDGKVAQTNFNADIAAVMNMSEEQLHAIVSGVDAITGQSSSEAGATEESGGTGSDAQAGPGDEQAGHTAGV